MERNSLYLITLSLLLLSTVVILAALRENKLDVYISLFTVEYFASSAAFRPKRRTADLIGVTLLAVFSFIVALKIIGILL